MRSVLMAACVTLATAGPALAQKSADTLRITWRDAIPDVDPYYNSLRTGMVVAFQAFDGLVYRDPVSQEIKPDLATSWTQVDPTTIDFTLRQGVKFQNGDPFTADDVVYTINDIIHDKLVAIPSYYTYLAGAEKIDDFHVRLKLKSVYPAAMENLAPPVRPCQAGRRDRCGGCRRLRRAGRADDARNAGPRHEPAPDRGADGS
jgi:peptide/nickel transport system substrate-binding protein